MATITPTTPTFTTLLAPQVVTTGNIGTMATPLDLKNKRGAYLYGFIGRRGATALTRPAYIMVRPSNNGNTVVPSAIHDMVSSIATAISNTVASGGASGATTVTLTSATSFAADDYICLHSDDTAGNRVEFARVVLVSTNTLTVDTPFETSHNAADRVTTMADRFRTWIPGGDIYDFRAVNNSGQDCVFALYAVVDNGDTYTP
jgi:hypothetical protein